MLFYLCLFSVLKIVTLCKECMDNTYQWVGVFCAQKIGGNMMNLNEYGWKDIYKFESEENGKFIYGRIVEIQREFYKVVCEYGEINAKLKGTFYKKDKENDFPVVGDFVLLKFNKDGISVIQKICNRISSFARTDFSGHAVGYVKTVKKQVLVANFDYVFIMSSMNKDFNINRIARYLSAAFQSGVKPVVILTKADICNNPDVYISQVEDISKDADIITISSKTGYGLERLNDYMKFGKTIVLLGSSGVGKSTLVNIVARETVMLVNGIREEDSKGRHTTTHRQLIQLGSKGMVIDTPGIRELGMWDSEDGINDTFSDVTELFSCCKFRNCSHNNEPGCAVKEAIEKGKLSSERWNMYCRLSYENKWGISKSAYTKKEKLHNKIRQG